MKKITRALSCLLAASMLQVPVWAQNETDPPAVFEFLKRLGVELPEDTEITDYSEAMEKREFVWLAVKALGKSVQTEKQYLTFSDVKLDDQMHDELIFGANIGLVSGKGDGSFGIHDEISEQDAALILMRALGFENLAQAVGARDVTASYSGVYQKLFKEVLRDGTLTVSEGYQMIYNMLQSDYVAMEIEGNTPSYRIVNDQPYMTAAFEMEKESGRVTGNQYTRLGLNTSGGALSSIELDGVEYRTTMEQPEDFLGYYVDYYIDNSDSKEPTVMWVIPKEKNKVTTIQSADLEKIEREGQKLVLNYDTGAEKNSKLRIPLSADFVYNGKTTDFTISLLEKLRDEQFGELTCVQYDDDWLLTVTAYETMIVETYSDFDEVIIGKNGERLLVKSEDGKDYRKLTKEEEAIDYTALAKGDVLEYARSGDGSWIDMRVSNYTLQAKLTSNISEDEISLDSVYYPLSNYFLKKVAPNFRGEVGSTMTFIFNTAGEVVDTVDRSAIYSGEYVFLLNAWDCSDEEEHLCKIKYVTMNGAMVTSYLAEKVKLNGASKEWAEDVVAKPLLPLLNGKKQRRLVYIEKNSEGKVKTIYTPDREGLDGIKRSNEILNQDAVEKNRKCKGSSIFLVDNNDMNFPEFYIDNNTKILMVPTSDANDAAFNEPSNYEAKGIGFFVDAQDYIVEAYNFNDFNVAEIMLLRQKQNFDSQHSSIDLTLVTEVTESLGEDDMPVETVVGYQDGNRVEIKMDSSDVLYLPSLNRNVQKGDFIRFNLNNKGYATHSEYWKSLDTANITLYPEGRNDGNAVAVGYVVSREDPYLKLNFTEKAQTQERVFRGTPASVTIIDSATGKCEKGTMADLIVGKKVLIRVFYSNLQDVFLFR